MMGASGTKTVLANRHGLALLPIEILDMIFNATELQFDDLFGIAWRSPEDRRRDSQQRARMAVALTCKLLFQFLGSRDFIKTLDEFDIHDLLETLERGLPHHFFCFGCERLHPLRPSVTEGWEHQGRAYLSCGPSVTEYWDRYKLLRPPQALPALPLTVETPDIFNVWERGDSPNEFEGRWDAYFDDPMAKLIQWHPKRMQSYELCWRPRI